MCTITHAEHMANLKKKGTDDNIFALKGYSLCLQICLESIYGSHLCTSLDISTAAMNAAKNMILGGYHLEEEELN